MASNNGYNEVLKRSVTRDDAERVHHLRYAFSQWGATPLTTLPYDLSPYWVPLRDVETYSGYVRNGTYADAVNIACVRFASLGFNVDNDIDRRIKRALKSLSRWYDTAIELARDYCTTDNGGFLEIVRATKAYSSAVIGFVHLSSFRCWRTGNPEIPVIYVDLMGRLHELKSHQVAEFSDMPNTLMRGIGLCATSRAWDAIYMDHAVKQYLKEKVTGRRSLGLYLVGGMRQTTVDEALEDAKLEAEAKGQRSYMGVTVHAEPAASGLSHLYLPFMSLPDGFDRKQHDDQTRVEFASALGIDATELDPRLMNHQLGSGAQAMVLDDKQASKGMIGLRQQITRFFNDTERWQPMPGSTTFAFSEKDLRDQKLAAETSGARATVRSTMIGSGEITPAEARQLAVDAGDLPESFAQPDLTPEASLSDEDKPDSLDPNTDVVLLSPEQEMVPEEEPEVAVKQTKLLEMYLPPRRGRVSAGEMDFLKRAEGELAEIGRTLKIAVQQNMPQEEGALNRSVTWKVVNKGTRQVALQLFAGNTSRPEVVIRASLFGRRGIRAKSGALRFRVGNSTVFARSVKGVLANDWLARALDATQPRIAAAEKELKTNFDMDAIDVSDIRGAQRMTRTSQLKPPKAKRR